MKKSLSLKMLLLTLGSFLVLISGTVLSLYIYFNHFYEPQKINRTIHALNEFAESYENRNWSDEALYQEVSRFMKNQNATMSILTYREMSDDIAFYQGAAGTMAQPAIKGAPLIFSLTQRPLPIESEETTYGTYVYAADSPAMSYGESSVSIVKGGSARFEMATSTIINDSFIFFPVGVTAAVKTSGIVEDHEKEGIRYILSDMPFTDFKQVDFIKQITLGNGEIKEAYVNISLQSVDEVMNVLNHFYPYLIAFAILLSLLMAYVYSKTVSKPIVAITEVANRMANMELGITSSLKRKDELGDLSLSLNTLSSNLKNTLDDLVVANRQLKKDYENEIKQEKARKEFVANVSHEIKTPLGVIKSFSEGIRDGVKAEKRDHYVAVIHEEIDKMERLLLEMLEVSRFDSGTVVYTKKDTHLKEMLSKLIGYFDNALEEKELSITIVGNFGIASIDEDKITRVLSNLIGNAIKYCSPHSTIKLRGEEIQGQTKIIVENDCEPLSEEALEKIWDRFYKVDTSHNRDKEGTGLGLAITKSILEGHGCGYGVENTDRGVRFYFTI